MSWFFERMTVPSDINGPIQCRRVLGEWTVSVGESQQVGAYLNRLWRQAVRSIPQPKRIRKILMYGLATGGTIPLFLKRFPRATITAIEIDPVMGELIERCSSIKQRNRVCIRMGDVADVVPSLQESYDLIVFDAFIGTKIAPVFRDERFLQQTLSITQSQGFWLVNAFLEPEVFDEMKKICGEVRRWRYRMNEVGLFRPWGAGTLGDPLPEGYQHFSTCADYMRRQFQGESVYRTIDAGEAHGLRRSLGSYCFDQYVGDVEPMCLPKVPRRLMTFWQPITRLVPPAGSGWRRFPFPGGRMLTGFALIPPTGSYHTQWSEHAKRHRARWLKQTTHEIVEADVQTYIDGYRRCQKSRSVIETFSDAIRKKAERHPGLLRLRVARDKQTHEIIAGFASLWIPEIRQTFHVTSLITKQGMDTSAAFGLVDDAFRLSQERGCRFFEFDGFWTWGNPRSWKGFSRFKSQFGTRYIRWPHPWFRFD